MYMGARLQLSSVPIGCCVCAEVVCCFDVDRTSTGIRIITTQHCCHHGTYLLVG